MDNPATHTALGTMTLVAIETLFPRGKSLTRDELAASVLPKGLRLFVRLMRVAWIREAMLRRLERDYPGTWAGIACRKACIDGG